MSRSDHNEARFDRAHRLPRYTDERTQIADALAEIAHDPSVSRLHVINDTDAWTTGPAWLDDCDNDRQPPVTSLAYTSESPRAQVQPKPAERVRVQHVQPRGRRIPQPPPLLQPRGPLYGAHGALDCWREQTSRRTGFSVCI